MSKVEVELVSDRTAETRSDQGFLKVRRYTLRTVYADGTKSAEYNYDIVDRTALDAVVMVLFAANEHNPADPYVCVRTALRPPVALRAKRKLAIREEPTALLWELPAGLIEANEPESDPVRATAARECEEETGYRVAISAFSILGPSVFLSPGLCAEKIHFALAQVDRSQPRHVTATETVELASTMQWITLAEAKKWMADGTLQDAKTEVALTRFERWLTAR
jgi:8-oxo-dGTP pyrophosphatase MutT (NUDIX family)